MRNIYTILSIILLTCSMALLPLTPTVHALPDPRIYLDPSDNTFYSNVTSVGHRFNVTIWVENTTDTEIGGAQVHMEFDDSMINVTRWWAPTWDANFFIPEPPPATLLPAPPDPGYLHIAAGKGRIEISVSKGGLPPTAPWGHDGKIAILEFTITAAPPEDGQLTCPLHINTTATYLLDSIGSEVPSVTKEDGTYSFIYIPPPPAAPHIWLEASPSTYEAIKPRPFNVTIMVKNVSALDSLIGIQLIVSYNATSLQGTEIIQGDFLNKSTWAPYSTIPTYYFDERGAVYGELILPNNTGQWTPPFPEGNGTVAVITFLPILHEEASFNITITPLFGQFFLDKDDEYIPYLPANNCQFMYNPLPVPTLAVTPSEYIASHIGETFDINVTINDLDGQWNMTYVEFKLGYNNNFLQMLNVTEGDFLSQFGTTTFNHEVDGYIKANITLTTTTYPSGSGTLATITFNVTSSLGSCALSLNETKLLDFEMEEVLHEVESGYYQLHEILVHSIVWDTETFNVITVSNTSLTPTPMLFYQPQMMLFFNVTGNNGTIGFVNITIPKVLFYASPPDWFVIVGGEMIEVTVVENATHTSLYFTLSLSAKTVYIMGTQVIPEITPNIFMLLLLAATLIGLAVAKKTLLKKREDLVHCKASSTRP